MMSLPVTELTGIMPMVLLGTGKINKFSQIHHDKMFDFFLG